MGTWESISELRSRLLAVESLFWATGTRFLTCGRRVWGLIVNFRLLRVEFSCLGVELGTMGVAIRLVHAFGSQYYIFGL